MAQKVKIALVGIAGYGVHFVNTVLDEGQDKDIELVAAVARRPERCERLAELKAMGAQVYSNLDEFYSKDSADLVIISSPIQLHCPFTCQALSQGSNVLCEKPVSATIQEALEMAEAEQNAKGFVAIGYQWGFAAAVHGLKSDIISGRFGAPVRMKCMVSWPRSRRYYGRNDWAGALKTADGAWVLDSPANNATAHYLFNMLYVLGDAPETSAMPRDVCAELYRANPIQNFDSAALRCHTQNGTEILFYTSHAVPSLIGPIFCYEFEEGTVFYEMGISGTLMARFRDGSVKSYGDPSSDQTNKTWQSVEAVRSGRRVVCDVRAATAQTLVLNGAQDSMPEVEQLDDSLIDVVGEGEEEVKFVKGLQATFVQCYDRGILPSEHGNMPWAREGRTIDLTSYRSFPSTPREAQGG